MVGGELPWGSDSAGFPLAASDLDRLRCSVGPPPLLAGHDGLSRFTVFTIGGPLGNPFVLLASSAIMVGVFRGLPTMAVVRLAVTFNGIRQSDGLARNGCLSIVESPCRRTSTEPKRKEPSWSKGPLTRNSL